MSIEMLRAAPLTRIPNWEQPNSPSPGECAGPPSSPGMSLHSASPREDGKSLQNVILVILFLP